MSELAWLTLAAALAGGLGAVLRLLLDGAVTLWSARRASGSVFPCGILAVNLSGSLAIGVATGALMGGSLAGSWWWVIGIGLLGGYTTFSSASFDTIRLLRARRPALALANGIGQLLAAVLLAGLGMWAGYSLAGA